MRRLEGKCAVVTGASSGIGRAIAVGFAAEGCRVAAGFRTNEAGARETVARIERAGGRAFDVQADVGDPMQADALFAAVHREFGRVDILVNNAGITPKGFLEQQTPEEWNRVVAANLSSVVFCTRAALPLMPDGGAVLNISSIHAVRTTFRFSLYAATKGGMEALTRSLALELSPRRIRVNALRPGWIQVDRDRIETSEPVYALAVERIPLGRPGEAGDVVPAAVLLCSDEAGYITGQVLGIDGGQEVALSTPYPTGFER